MADDEGFLSRWSRRKVQLRSGAPVVEAPPVAEAAPVVVEPPPAPAPVAAVEPEPPPADPPPTLADVMKLGRESDFSRFVAADVDGEVKNAALKKLFTDPHFNIMDGLDTYIDDYGKPDPIPESMLRQMVQSKLLGLFRDEEEPPAAASPPPALPEPTAHENPDLRLQPDDDAGCTGPEPGAGEDPGRQH
jgi:hypothetical protein